MASYLGAAATEPRPPTVFVMGEEVAGVFYERVTIDHNLISGGLFHGINVTSAFDVVIEDNVVQGYTGTKSWIRIDDVVITPGPGGNFLEGRRSLTVGVEANYLNEWSVDVSYTRFMGAGNFNLIHDRDFVAFTARYAF